MTKYHEAGKGSSSRPRQVSNEDYENRWDAIFHRDKTKEELPKKELFPLCPHNVWAIHSGSTKDNTVYVCMECGLAGKDTQATR